jgi:DNA invertase Pin-like site-specific DNA recombinase
VRDNTESTARQYALADESVRLGWARQRVEVIDADLGLSGRSADGRSGFKELVSRVCLGEVGAIFGLEVSRLARSSANLSRLLELARLTDTLVVDADGIYDLANFNDRLLLGLKGTMSEAELHFLTGRMNGAKRAAAERGDLRFPLPVGLVHDDEGATIIDLDAEVQAALCDVFAAFRAGGSTYQVVAAFEGRRFPCAPTAECGPVSCAGAASSTPGCSASWPTRPMRAPTSTAATTPAGSSSPMGPCALRSSNCPEKHGRSSSTTTIPATSAGRTIWPTAPAWLPTPPTPGPGRPVKVTPCARGSSPAGRVGDPCPLAITATATPPMSALRQGRPDGHGHVPVDQRYHRGRGGGRTTSRGAQPRGHRSGPGSR